MDNSDYKNDNEAASGLAKVANTIGRVLMSPIDAWNNMASYKRENIKGTAFWLGVPAVVLGSIVVAANMVDKDMIEKKEAAILQEMDKIQYEQVVDIGNGQYGATEMSADVKADIRATAEKIIAGDVVKKRITELCLDDVVYYLYKDGVGKTATSSMTAKIDSETLMPERCEVEASSAPKM